MVGLRIDLTVRGTFKYYISTEFHGSVEIEGYPTFCRLPVPSFNASKPPGPKLLLRGFLLAVSFIASTSAPLFLFSCPMLCSDAGTWAMDLRERRRIGEAPGLWIVDILETTTLHKYCMPQVPVTISRPSSRSRHEMLR